MTQYICPKFGRLWPGVWIDESHGHNYCNAEAQQLVDILSFPATTTNPGRRNDIDQQYPPSRLQVSPPPNILPALRNPLHPQLGYLMPSPNDYPAPAAPWQYPAYPAQPILSRTSI